MMHAVTCSCGSILQSEDEEELYSLARGHAAQLHPEPSSSGINHLVGRHSLESVVVHSIEAAEGGVEEQTPVVALGS